MTKLETISFYNSIINFEYVTRICLEKSIIFIYFTHEPNCMRIEYETEDKAKSQFEKIRKAL